MHMCFFLLLFFTNYKNEIASTAQGKIKQTSFFVHANNKNAVDYYRNEIESAVSLLVSQKQIINRELN